MTVTGGAPWPSGDDSVSRSRRGGRHRPADESVDEPDPSARSAGWPAGRAPWYAPDQQARYEEPPPQPQ
ncbi:MAG TPA: hypothetical protein VIR27_19110, partial [Mycobacteriales bacterium]